MSIHPSADVAETAEVAETAKIWHHAQVREKASIAKDCIVGRGAYIGTGVVVGAGCKIQNYALVYEPAVLEEGVFIGPAAVLTNDEFPRAINTDMSPKSSEDWQAVGVYVKRGASIGANATCVAPVIIGEWALVGSGAVVTKDVPNFALVVGNPAKRIRWVSKSGVPLEISENDDEYHCPKTGERYRQISENELIEVVEK